jgi:A/G-specific adenine glycosylase
MPPRQEQRPLDPMVPDASWRRLFRRQLAGWFRRQARDLPWRRSRDPYAIWVSEIMLQQTQVATVIDYFERFLNAFPSITALAAADEAQVLRQWEGLGYYRRARQLHRAAGVIVQQHGGCFPRDPQAILALPGIGRYTAGAIASIAWDARQPILEANTIRLFARLLAYHEDPGHSAAQRQFWEFAERLLPRTRVGAFNQALMELGSTVCAPRAPRCEQCPVQRLCPTFALGLQSQIPAAAKKTVYESVLEAALVIRRRGHVLLRRCGPQERWAGLWDFPRFAVRSRGRTFAAEAARQAAELTGQHVEVGRHLTTIKHGVTRFRITLLCHEAHWLSGGGEADDLRWLEPAQLEEYPLSVTGRKISRLLVGAV